MTPTSVTGISFVILCDQNRYDDYFLTTYNLYMKYGFPSHVKYEFLLVTRTITECDLPNVRLIPYTWEGKYFCTPLGLNLGVRSAQYDNIIITCPEIIPLTDVVAQLLSQERGNYICQVYDQNQDGSIISLVNSQHRAHIPAWYFLAMFKKEDIQAVNGWDERFMAGFAWEDVDFGERFSRAGLTWKVMDHIRGLHLWHPRNYNQEGWELNWHIMEDCIRTQHVMCKTGLIHY